VVETSFDWNEEIHEQHADEYDERGTPEEKHHVPHLAVSHILRPDLKSQLVAAERQKATSSRNHQRVVPLRRMT